MCLLKPTLTAALAVIAAAAIQGTIRDAATHSHTHTRTRYLIRQSQAKEPNAEAIPCCIGQDTETPGHPCIWYRCD